MRKEKELLGWAVAVGCLVAASPAFAVSIGSIGLGTPPAKLVADPPSWLIDLFEPPPVSWSGGFEPGPDGIFPGPPGSKPLWEALMLLRSALFALLFGGEFDFPFPPGPGTFGTLDAGGSPGAGAFDIGVVPEPAPAVLVALGIAAIAAGARRRHSA